MRGLALIISFGAGFLSLSQEILYVRLVSLMQEGRPHAFSLVLTAFLLGVTCGAIMGRRLCSRSTNLPRTLAGALLIAALADGVFLVLASQPPVASTGSPSGLMLLLTMVLMAAALKGVVFPVVHHMGSMTGGPRLGRSISQVYVANVLGCTLGPLVTGFFLLDLVKLERALALTAWATALLGCMALVWVRPTARPKGRLALACGLALCLLSTVAISPPEIVAAIASRNKGGEKVVQVVQNLHGILHVTAEREPGTGDVVYGGNKYDGRMAVDMKVNSNGLDRAYQVATIHPHPRRALVIGLGGGAWATAVAGIPGIVRIDIVELNPGYLEIVGRYPAVAPLLKDERVTIHIGDGRRWLKQEDLPPYDLVIQNTTFYWRKNSTRLLSVEHFQLVKSKLAPGGILAVNSTGSFEVYKTGLQVFEHVGHHGNFAYMSDKPLTKRVDAEGVLRACSVWGKPAFDDPQFQPGAVGRELASRPLESAEDFLKRKERFATTEVISDLNLLTEYRRGAGPPFQWLHWLQP
jgi:predicted membrane-bound spermidine synthase